MNKEYFVCICKQTWSDSVKINFIEGKFYNCYNFSKNAITALDEDNSAYTFIKNDFYTIFYTDQEVRQKKLKKLNESNL